jgi:hypothetical protein
MTAPFTLREQQKEAERELALRTHVYPKWIAAGKLTVAKANRQTDLMRAIVNTLRDLADAEERHGKLAQHFNRSTP